MKNFVLYTVLTGWESELNNPFPQDSSQVELICFTDNLSIDANGWKLVKLESHYLDHTREARRPKHLPHLYLPGFEWSLYIDNTIKLKTDPLEMLRLHIQRQKNYWCFRHPQRDCIYDEAEEIIRLQYDDERRVREQMDHYRRMGFPRKAGLCATGVLLRKHNEGSVVRLSEIWFEHVLRFSRRDQLSFNFVAQQLNFDYGLFEGELTDSQFTLWPGYSNQLRLPKDFDETMYEKLNPEVIKSGLPARQHYMMIGMKIGLSYKETNTLESQFVERAQVIQALQYAASQEEAGSAGARGAD